VELPVILGEESHHEFSRRNDPLSEMMIETFIAPWETDDIDFELTEYIACFRIANTKDFHALVYWRAGLMDYRYVLATYSKTGKMLDSRVIAGLYSDGQTLIQSVATIDEDWGISIASGQSDAKSGDFDPSASTQYTLELMEDGSIANE
jgi:hypothetical protein